MATVREMKRSGLNSPAPSHGSLYTEKITLIDTAESEVVTFPLSRMYAITLNLSGDGTISFTNDSYEDINDDTADYEVWNGSSLVNLGVTAFKVERLSGTVVAKVAVKTDTE